MTKLRFAGLIAVSILQVSPVFSQISSAVIKQEILNMPLDSMAAKGEFSRHNKPGNTLYLPLALTAYGFISLENDGLQRINWKFREEILEHHPYFKTSADNYLQFAPMVTTFALKLAGAKSEHTLLNSARLYATSTLLMGGTVYALKSITGELRPDGSSHTSFPSGHTATAFAAAEFMHQEFKNSSPLLSYSGYVAASATGTLRMYNNKHYLSDVLAGAGIGILTTKAAYWVNRQLFEKNKPLGKN